MCFTTVNNFKALGDADSNNSEKDSVIIEMKLDARKLNIFVHMRKSFDELPEDNNAIIEKYKILNDSFEQTDLSYKCPSD